MTIGKRIRELRLQKGWSQLELANRLDVSYQVISQYERDKRTPKISTIHRIADALGVSMSAFTETEITWIDSNGAYQFTEPITDNPQWLVELESKLKSIDARVGQDPVTSNWYILYSGGQLNLSEQDLILLNDSANSFLHFKLEELKMQGK